MKIMDLLAQKWELEMRLPCGGHRVFKRPYRSLGGGMEYQYAIADDSGRWPHTTDDGVLYLDFLRPLQLDGNGRWVGIIPLTDETGLETATVDSIPGVLLLADRFKWPLMYRKHEFQITKVVRE